MPPKKRPLTEADIDAQAAPVPAKKTAKAAGKGKGKEKQAAPARREKSISSTRVRECGLVRGKKPKIPSLESCKGDLAKLEAGRLHVLGDPLKYFALCRRPWDISDDDAIRAFICDLGATCKCNNPTEGYPGHTFIISGRGLRNLNIMVEAAESRRPESVLIQNGYAGYEVIETLDDAVSSRYAFESRFD